MIDHGTQVPLSARIKAWALQKNSTFTVVPSKNHARAPCSDTKCEQPKTPTTPGEPMFTTFHFLGDFDWFHTRFERLKGLYSFPVHRKLRKKNLWHQLYEDTREGLP